MTTLFDAGDIQRLERERALTEQAPRQLIEEDRTPIEEPSIEDDDMDIMLDSLLDTLKRRL